jgi:hypothetical protein
MIQVERFIPEKHYETIGEWWKAQKWPVLPLKTLSKTGIVVTLNDKPAAACWIYQTDSSICWLEWVVCNPEVRREARTDVLSTLIQSAKDVAQAMGFESIFTSLKNESMAHRIKSHGFHATDTGVTQYFCHLNGGV